MSLPLEINEYLSKYFGADGLADPLIGKPLPYKYGNAFFALHSALLYNKTKKKKWEEFAREAVRIELEYTRQRRKHLELFRWEFKNYAILQIIKHLPLDGHFLREVEERARTPHNQGSFKTNWMAMRALNYITRYNLFENPLDKKRAERELNKVLERQTRDGLFYDDRDSDSFQYHAYICALLCQYYEETKEERLKKRILKGLDFIKTTTDPKGDCMYFGRGQEQVFGYSTAIFALSYGHKHLNNKKKYDEFAKLIYNFITPFLKNKRIIANNDEKERAGWYEYNCTLDYLPFAATYLTLAEQLINFKKVKIAKKKEYEIFLNDSRLFIKNTKQYFIVVCAGNKNSSELPGLTHLHPSPIPCSGGPPINLKGKEAYTNNFLGLGKRLILTKGNFKRDKEKLMLDFNTKDADVRYEWVLNKNIKFTIKVKPRRFIKVHPLHYTSKKLLDNTPKKGEILTPHGKVNIYYERAIKTKDAFNRSLLLFKGKNKSKTPIAKPKEKKERKKHTTQKIDHFITLALKRLIHSPFDFLYSFIFLYKRNNYKRN